MQIYAERPGRRARQVLSDLLIAGWVALCVWVAAQVRDLVLALAAPGRKVEEAGQSMAASLAEAQHRVDRVPVVGDSLSDPLGSASNAARSLADAAHQQQIVVDRLAWVLAVLVVVVPVLVAVLPWLALRIHWIRQAAVARFLMVSRDGEAVLAVRAVARRPLRELRLVPEGTVSALLAGDHSATRHLAALELAKLGLRAPLRVSDVGERLR